MINDRHRFVLMYVLSLFASFIAIRIELLNARAGGVLPRREYINDNPADGLVTWRESIITNEERWREAHELGSSRTLTPAEKQRMHADIAEARANNALLAFVGTFGVLQSVCAPVLVLMSVFMIRRRRGSAKHVLGSVPPLLVGLVYTILLVYRQYVTSLGW